VEKVAGEVKIKMQLRISN